MRKCKYSESDLSRYLQNKMSRDEQTEFQSHLSSCSFCQKELDSMRTIIRYLEQKEGTKKKWIIAVAIACSVAGGIYFLPQNKPTPKRFDFNQPLQHDDLDSIEVADTLLLDTISL